MVSTLVRNSVADRANEQKLEMKKCDISVSVPETLADSSSSGSDSTTESSPKKRKRLDVAELEIDVSLPEPPSKKSLRKAKKLKTGFDPEALLDKKEDKNDSSQGTTTETIPQSVKRSEYGIWIGNLPWAISKDVLRQFFIDSSGITEKQILRIHMPAPPKQEVSKQKLKSQNKGFAYLDFANSHALHEALALGETMLGGRRVLIKDAKSFEGRPDKKMSDKDFQKEGTVTGKQLSKRIFIGNLGFDVTKENLEQHFSPCGTIEGVHMATFEDTGNCKGFAWVTFETTEAAKAAIQGWTYLETEKGNDEGDDETEAEGKNVEETLVKVKKTKPRKWFVNKMFGRPLRCEFAEDPSTRYKKRFGKDAGKNKSVASGSIDPFVPNEQEKSYNGPPLQKPRNKSISAIEPGAPTDRAKRRGRSDASSAADPKTMYRTGAIIQSHGNRTVFE